MNDLNGQTALSSASAAGHVEIVHLLLEARAETDAADNSGSKLCTMHPALVSSTSSGYCSGPVPIRI